MFITLLKFRKKNDISILGVAFFQLFTQNTDNDVVRLRSVLLKPVSERASAHSRKNNKRVMRAFATYLKRPPDSSRPPPRCFPLLLTTANTVSCVECEF